MNVQKTILLLYGVTAAVWILNCVRDFSSQGQTSGIRVLCAAAWTLSFFLYLLRDRNEK